MTEVLSRGAVQLDDGLQAVADGLRGYVLDVAATLGLGAESCAINPRRPACGYIAVNLRIPRFPGRDLVLRWDERHGWSAAAEKDFGQHVTTVARLRGAVRPDPVEVQAFVDDLVAGTDDRERRPRGVLRRLRGHTAA